jgi:hypothetical protein
MSAAASERLSSALIAAAGGSLRGSSFASPKIGSCGGNADDFAVACW